MTTAFDWLDALGSTTNAHNNVDLVAAARDRGIERSSKTAGTLWFEVVTDMLKVLLSENRKVVSDDLWELGLPYTKSPRALGAVMTNAVKQGWMQPIVYEDEDGDFLCRKSKRRNKGLVQVWQSKLYGVPPETVAIEWPEHLDF